MTHDDSSGHTSEQTRTPGNLFDKDEIAYWGRTFRRHLDHPQSWRKERSEERAKEVLALLCARQDVGYFVPGADAANRNYFKRYSASYYNEWWQSLQHWRLRLSDMDIRAVLTDMAKRGVFPDRDGSALEGAALAEQGGN